MIPRNWEDIDIDPPTFEEIAAWNQEALDAMMDMDNDDFYGEWEDDE